MVTGKNVCPICKNKYAPKNESKYKVDDENVCMSCAKKKKKHADYGFTIKYGGLIYYFDDDGNYERAKFG